MTDRATIESRLRESYAARLAGDLEGTVRHFADNAVFALAGAEEASPVPVRCMGREPLRNLMAGLIDAFKFSDHEILSLIIDGSRAAVHARLHVRSTASGEGAVTETVDLIAFEDGKIVSFTQFFDTALAAKLVGP